LRLRPGAGGPGQAARTEAEIRSLFASTAFELVPGRDRVRMRGQDRTHHRADPDLPQGAAAWGVTGDRGIGAYRTRRPAHGLTFEDSWSGWVFAETLAELGPREPVVVIHLDDHRDLMPTLLDRGTAGDLVNPATGRVFDAASRADWASAIATGAVNIGNWLSAFVLGAIGPAAGRAVHVRHLHPEAGSSAAMAPCTLVPDVVSPGILPDHAFARIATAPPQGRHAGTASTFRASSDIGTALACLPEGRVLLHVDLDYFHNDFNGNIGQQAGARDIAATGGAGRLASVLDHLAAAGRPVADAVVATSPGFCACGRWPDLTGRIAEMLDRAAGSRR